MTDQEFIDKWRGEVQGWWAEAPGPLFWARSYKMDQDSLREMAEDFIHLEVVPKGPSRSLALATLNTKD